MGRLILVSNRLPVTVRAEHGELKVSRSPGGLATGLAQAHAEADSLWIGWPGETGHLDAALCGELDRRLAELRCVPVTLTASEVAAYYDHFSNRVLWPLFHYMPDRIPNDARHWDVYRRVNRRFADAVLAHAREDDVIWVQDYHLLLVPAMLRERLPDAKIGLFLHIPFPSAEVFRTLPWRRPILDGMLAADLVGVHTPSYALHLQTAAARFASPHRCKIAAYPMGVDTPHIEAIARDPGLGEDVRAIRGDSGEHVLLGIDRLDYTKGIPRRLLALERLLERERSWRGRIRLVQLSVPSREKVEDYQQLRDEVERLVGRINGLHTVRNSVPVHYLYRAVPERRVIALYRAADVALVTPLRDGMNLVAKEFVASRVDGDGVLVLSELAGAAEELGGALTINPYDVDGMAQGLERALTMSEAERRLRMRHLRDRVGTWTVHRWAEAFLDDLAAQGTRAPSRPDDVVRAIAGEGGRAVRTAVLVDYDGTLVGFTERPGDASPGRAVRDLLRRVAEVAAVTVVSGRRKEDLEGWLGDLPIGLVAEHGLWTRPFGGDWRSLPVDASFKDVVRDLFAEWVSRVPGALIEEKSASLAWHYRASALAGPPTRLVSALEEMTTWLPVDLLVGDKVLEVRARGVHKGGPVPALVEGADRVVAIGDDRTDEDLFAAVPEGSITVKVGRGPTRARYRVAGPADVHAILEALAAEGAQDVSARRAER